MTYRSFVRSVALATVVVTASGCHRSVSAKPIDSTTTTTAAPLPPLAGSPDVASLVARVDPAVVNITITQDVKRPKIPGFGEWPFGSFGNDEGRMQRQALGSGFIVDSRGHVVTNAHVVANADRVRVRLADERELDAKVKGRDERLDLAVLEIEGAKDLPAVTLGSSESLRVGDYVVAIGNPFGLGHTVTTGIVSAKSRAIGAGPYDDFIQTDASINPGNSGGPLFNTRGEVIGVNTAINPAGQGIGFAIPSDALKDVLPQLIEKGHVARGRLGVQIQNVDEVMAKVLHLEKARGALVGDVEPNSAGAKAGLKSGDVIVGFEGRDVAHSQDLPRMVARHAPGSRVKVEILRDQTKRTIEVTLDELKDSAQAADGRPRQAPVHDGALGLELDDSAEGVVVRSVTPGSVAAGALAPGDVLVEIDRKPITKARDASAALAGRTGAVLLRVKRQGTTHYVALDARR